MEILTPKYRRNPNAMVHSAYVGVAPGNRTVTRITQQSGRVDGLETSRVYGAGIPRGQGGRIATIVLAGMETTLDEVEDMLLGIKEKKFRPVRRPSDIAMRIRMQMERRNNLIRYYRKNPSEAPKFRPKKKQLYLPRGYRMADTSVPGFQITVRG